MNDPHQQSLDDYTNQQQIDDQQLEQENTEDYSLQFENRYKIYQLNSKVNEANLRLQKMSLQFQNQIKEERHYYLQIQQERQQIAQKYAQLYEESHKLSVMLQAQRTSRTAASKQLKIFKQQSRNIRQLLGVSADESIESVTSQFFKLKNRINDTETANKQLNQEVLKLKLKYQQQLKQIRHQSERKASQLNQNYSKKLTNTEGSRSEIKNQLITKQAIIRQQNIKIAKLQKIEQQYHEQVRKLQTSYNLNLAKEEELCSLRVKQQYWVLARQKTREEKLKYDQKIEQLKFQLQLTSKRLQINQGKIKQQQNKSSKLQQILAEYKQRLRKNEEMYMELQEQCGQFKNKLHVSDIYKQKYKAVQTQMKETEERAKQFGNMADQYANQIQLLQDQIAREQEQRYRLEEDYKYCTCQLQEKGKQIIKKNLIISHQQEIIKENKGEIEQMKQRIDQLSRDIPQNQARRSYEQQQNDRIQVKQLNENIMQHYQKLLDAEDKSRKQLQNQLQNASSNTLQLNTQIAALNRQINQIKQERNILKQQNQRIGRRNGDMYRMQQKKIDQLRERYKQIYSINKENNLKPKIKLRIVNCFSFTQKGDTNFNEIHQSVISLKRQSNNQHQQRTKSHKFQS